MIRDFLKMAVENFRHRKMRSWLTMVGIFIGITAVIAIISLGQGLGVAITEQFNELGSDKLWLQPGTNQLNTGAASVILDDRDMKNVQQTQGVDKTLGFAYQNTKIENHDEEAFVLVMGYDLEEDTTLRDELYAVNIEEGRWHDSGDTFKVVAGYDYRRDDKVFTRGLQLFDTITINGFDFKIIGFQEKVGNSIDDQTLFITDDAYRRLFEKNIEDEYKFIAIKTANGEDPSEVAERVKKNLRNDRGLDEGDEDFILQTTEELMSSFNVILQIVNVVIVGLAAISLLVGGIGIMNTMYTAVVERTKEIGIMKAIGAQNSDILLLFLLESGLLGFIGGVIGVVLGLGLAFLVQWLGVAVLESNLIKAWWSWELIVGALLFAVLAGVVSGALPARQASKQQAVDSLRYE